MKRGPKGLKEEALSGAMFDGIGGLKAGLRDDLYSLHYLAPSIPGGEGKFCLSANDLKKTIQAKYSGV